MFQISAIVVLTAFYFIYFGKIIIQNKKGIQTDQIAKGKNNTKLFLIELILKVSTYSVVIIEIISIIFNITMLSLFFRIIGLIFCICGVVIFYLSVCTMKDNWRAGIAENDKTSIVIIGIYRFSRNPAFLGFDLIYIGVLLMFFNFVLLLFSTFSVVMLHLQILQEENFLPSAFGEDYLIYKNQVNRYFGRK